MEIEGVSLLAFVVKLPAVRVIGEPNNTAINLTSLAFVSNKLKLLSSRNELLNLLRAILVGRLYYRQLVS